MRRRATVVRGVCGADPQLGYTHGSAWYGDEEREQGEEGGGRREAGGERRETGDAIRATHDERRDERR